MENVYFNSDKNLITYETDGSGKHHGRLFLWDDREDDFVFHSIVNHNEIMKAIKDSDQENLSSPYTNGIIEDEQETIN